jgi:hypothetical protein
MWQGEEYYHRRQAIAHHQQVGRDVLDARTEQAVMRQQLGKILQWLGDSFTTWRQLVQAAKLGIALACKWKQSEMQLDKDSGSTVLLRPTAKVSTSNQ